MKSFIGITGTTCVGKSQVAVILAEKLKTEIISADSMQIYKGMDIGTAKITDKEMHGIKHYMLDIVCPNENYSSFEYQQIASQIINSMTTVPIVVGGTGFYFDSLLYPPEFGGGNAVRRAELQQILQSEGLETLVAMLEKLDQEAYNKIDLKNPVRVIRAIEIAENGESRFSGKNRPAQFDGKIFVLQRDRQSLYEQIDKRVDTMIENGLVKEVQKLLDTYGLCKTSAFSAIGYKEIISYLNNECSLEQAINQIKLNTRHYAKRQQTYFKKMNITKFIDVDNMSAEMVADEIMKNI